MSQEEKLVWAFLLTALFSLIAFGTYQVSAHPVTL